MYKIQIDVPNLDKGALVELDSLGIYENGSTVEITEEQAEAFRVRNQTSTTTYTENGDRKVVYEKGPTVLRAFRSTAGITVTKETGSDSNSAAPVVSESTETPATDKKEEKK